MYFWTFAMLKIFYVQTSWFILQSEATARKFAANQGVRGGVLINSKNMFISSVKCYNISSKTFNGRFLFPFIKHKTPSTYRHLESTELAATGFSRNNGIFLSRTLTAIFVCKEHLVPIIIPSSSSLSIILSGSS